MQLELHRIERKYHHLRCNETGRKARMIASLVELGQQQPVLVVEARESPHRYVLIDGYLRFSALEELGHDVIEVFELKQSESDALLFVHRSARGVRRSALEQAWLIRELVEAHRMDLGAVAARLCRSRSWASRHLGLVRVLPEKAEQAVLTGQISPQAATKYLVPLARANAAQCRQLIENIKGEHLSVRQLGRIYAAWRVAKRAQRELIIAEPLRLLDVEAALEEPVDDPGQERDRVLVEQMGALSGLCRGLRKRLAERVRHERSLPWPTVLRAGWQEAQAAFCGLVEDITKVDSNDRL